VDKEKKEEEFEIRELRELREVKHEIEGSEEEPRKKKKTQNAKRKKSFEQLLFQFPYSYSFYSSLDFLLDFLAEKNQSRIN